MNKRKHIKTPPARSKGRFEVREENIPSRSTNSLRPIFSFHHMPYGDEHSLTKCEPHVKSSVADTIVRLSQLTWGRIVSEPREGLGCEKIPHNQFRVPLPEVITEEVPVLVFRHSDSGRIAGFRSRDIYHVILIGDDLYNH